MLCVLCFSLQFEWAWQNPHKSRRLKSIDGKTKSRKEKGYEYKVRVLSMMLSSGPWNRLPLTVRWLKQVIPSVESKSSKLLCEQFVLGNHNIFFNVLTNFRST